MEGITIRTHTAVVNTSSFNYKMLYKIIVCYILALILYLWYRCRRKLERDHSKLAAKMDKVLAEENHLVEETKRLG